MQWQLFKPLKKVHHCFDFEQAFVRHIQKIVSGYDEGRVIFDRYINNALKDLIPGKKCVDIDPVIFYIKDSTNVKLVSLRTLLSHFETKDRITEYLGKTLFQKYFDSRKSLVVVYGTTTYFNKSDVFHPSAAEHSREETDTLIPLHVLDAVSSSHENVRDVDVYSPDTDVFILLRNTKRTTDIHAKCLAAE